MAISVAHCGHTGDIIYSLPALKCLSDKYDELINFHFIYNKVNDKPTGNHPYGRVLMPKNVAEMLSSLIIKQNYIYGTSIYEYNYGVDIEVDIDLNDFRDIGIDMTQGNISNYYALLLDKYGMPINLDLEQKTIISDNKYPEFSDKIAISRSARYRNNDLWSNKTLIKDIITKNIDKYVFLGLSEEHQDFIKEFDIPELKHEITNDFVKLADIVNSCKLLIGNQSFIFSLGEQLKVLRYLEQSLIAPNVHPINNGYILTEPKQLHDVLLSAM